MRHKARRDAVVMFIFRAPFPTAISNNARPHRQLMACGLALLICAGGCAGPSTNNGAADSAVNASAQSNSASWGEVLQKWWQATSEATSQKNTPAAPSPTISSAPTQSEIAALAARHPAWKLADALEKNRAQSLDFEAVRGSSAPGSNTLAAPGFDVDFSDPDSSGGGTDGERATLPSPAGARNETDEVTSGLDAIVTDLDDWQDEARTRQEESIAGFLRSVAARQSDWQRDYSEILRVALGEEIQAAAERTPSAIALVLPSGDMQLEMTNLRLRLLSNIFATEEERRAARDRLDELMSQWRAALHEQETKRAEELKRLRIEEPAQLRRAGLARLETELETIRRVQQETRSAVAIEHRARLEEDFGTERARLALTFPTPPEVIGQAAGTELPVGSTISSSEHGVPFWQNIVFMRTNSARLSSVNAFAGASAATTMVRDNRAEQIRALRRIALRDAKRQAQMAARLGD